MHYTIIADRMDAAQDFSQPYGLRDVDRAYFRAHIRHRFLFWRVDTLLMEFRSQWLARLIVLLPSGHVRSRHERWDHPIADWTLPLELVRTEDWQEITPEEFQRASRSS